jgi:hypothetical protein
MLVHGDTEHKLPPMAGFRAGRAANRDSDQAPRWLGSSLGHMLSAMDEVRLYLRARGVGPHVVKGGLEYLLGRWRHLADQVAEGRERWYWEEWLNNLDVREILHGVLDHTPDSRSALTEIAAADRRFLAATIETEECVWGERNEREHGWSSERNWWYWREPPTPYLRDT